MSATTEIKKAAVIGAGAMGSGIAAQLANAGIDVFLLDIVPQDATDRSVIAKGAIERMLKATPATDPLSAGFMDPSHAKRITPGNTEDDLETAVKEADWIVEVVIEDLAIKRELYGRLESLIKPDAIVSSNTSTIPLKDLVEGRSEAFKRHFVITHFFNPPRFMHLLELVGGELTDPSVITTLQDFGDRALGKNVIVCKDTPGFIANRIGIYFMFRAIMEALARNIKIEEVDAILGKPMGYPKDGIFGLLDLVGIGVIPHVVDSLLNTLPADDAFRNMDHQKGLSVINTMLADGRSGRKSPKGGFYRMQKNADGSKQKQAMDLKTGEYYDVGRPKLKGVSAARKSGPRAAFETEDNIGAFAWVVMRDTLLYAVNLIPEIADDIADVDAAMRDGYNHQWGPFELIDKLGTNWFTSELQADTLPVPPLLQMAGGRPFYRDGQRLTFDFKNQKADYTPLPQKEGILRLADCKRNRQPLVTHYSASLWDIGDGVACLEFHSKMNTLDSSILWVIHQSLDYLPKHGYKGMVIYNDAKNFSLGANLGLVQAGFQAARVPWVKAVGLSGLFNQKMIEVVDSMIFHGQSLFQNLREAPFPVIGAPQGMALGGGCEILLHCDAIQAGAETYMGLVESGVGAVPAWGGCVRYLERCMQDPKRKGGPMPPVRNAFQTILMPQFAVSNSAHDAKRKRWLQPDDGITMNPDRLLAEAKAKALAMAENYTPPTRAKFALSGPAGKSALRMAIDDFYIKGDATYHDVVVADALANVLTGGETHVGILRTEDDVAQLERENFLSLLKTPETQKRIAHTLKTGKPLREDYDGRPLDAIRATFKSKKLPSKNRQPLMGEEVFKLRIMAEISAFLLKQVSG